MEETRRDNKREVELKHFQYLNKICAPRDFRFTFTLRLQPASFGLEAAKVKQERELRQSAHPLFMGSSCFFMAVHAQDQNQTLRCQP